MMEQWYFKKLVTSKTRVKRIPNQEPRVAKELPVLEPTRDARSVRKSGV